MFQPSGECEFFTNNYPATSFNEPCEKSPLIASKISLGCEQPVAVVEFIAALFVMAKQIKLGAGKRLLEGR